MSRWFAEQFGVHVENSRDEMPNTPKVYANVDSVPEFALFVPFKEATKAVMEHCQHSTDRDDAIQKLREALAHAMKVVKH